jgi:hypothetical protein
MNDGHAAVVLEQKTEKVSFGKNLYKYLWKVSTGLRTFIEEDATIFVAPTGPSQVKAMRCAFYRKRYSE